MRLTGWAMMAALVLTASAAAAPAPKPFSLFQPRAAGFSPANAYLCLYASMLNFRIDAEGQTRYEYDENVRARLMEWGAERVDFAEDRGTDTRCIILSDRRMVLVAFRGTEMSKVRNWFVNIRAAQIGGGPWKKGKVHRGFANACNSMLDDVRRLVSLHAKVGDTWRKPVWLSGYSLGGATAVLTAFRLKNERYPVQGIYTFGQPAVAGSEFMRQITDELRLPYCRIVNYSDLVPKLPGRNLLGAKYDHAGVLCFGTKDGELLVNPDEETLRLSPNPFHIGDVARLGRWIEGHDIFRYCRLLFTNLPVALQLQLPPPPEEKPNKGPTPAVSLPCATTRASTGPRPPTPPDARG